MAKARRRGGMRRYMKGLISQDLALSTLATETATTFNTGTTDTNVKVTSVVCTYAAQGLDTSAGSGQGPLAVGWAHGDYSSNEIEAWFQASGTWQEGDLVVREIRSRLIRTVGTFTVVDAGSDSGQQLNDGKPIKTKLNWFIEDGESLQGFVYNYGSGNLVTGIEVYFEGYANLFGV